MDEEVEIYLLVVKNEKDADGFPVEKTERYLEYATKKSVTRSEFWQALQNGITAKMVLEMRTEDWEETATRNGIKKEYPTQLEYDGEIYDIVRTYQTSKAKIELTCK